MIRSPVTVHRRRLLALAAGGLVAASLAASLGPGEAARAVADDAAFLSFQGGGFTFNYRNAYAFMTVVLKPERAFPAGTLIEVAFPDPAGGAPFVVTEAYRGGQRAIAVSSPTELTGIRRETDYPVTVRLIDPATKTAFASYARTYRSDLESAVLPEKPQFIGPGYHRNPELDTPGGRAVILPPQ